jgi:hypothetical protein
VDGAYAIRVSKALHAHSSLPLALPVKLIYSFQLKTITALQAAFSLSLEIVCRVLWDAFNAINPIATVAMVTNCLLMENVQTDVCNKYL